MRFIDEVEIEVQAGHGGAGCISFRRERFIPKGGPDGGDGGRGGHVLLKATTRKNTLLELYLRKRIVAENGQPGQGGNRHGRNGRDVIVEVPVGTVVKDEHGRVIADLDKEGAVCLLARGGRGGFGNKHFANAVRQAPRFAQPGEEGERVKCVLELKSIADVGLVGLPNAGKSTLLSRISNAHPKVAPYPFTTLTPVLGLVIVDGLEGFVVADIPGLIAGAHEGKGLGDRFLRHIERTRVLMHVVDAADPSGRSIHEQVEEVEKEMEAYGHGLMQKPRILAVNKVDALNADLRKRVESELAGIDLPACLVSAVTGEGIADLIHRCHELLTRENS